MLISWFRVQVMQPHSDSSNNIIMHSHYQRQQQLQPHHCPTTKVMLRLNSPGIEEAHRAQCVILMGRYKGKAASK